MSTSSGIEAFGQGATDDGATATEFLIADLPPSSPDQPFSISDEDKANWLVRKIVELRAYHGRVAAWAAKESNAQAEAIHVVDLVTPNDARRRASIYPAA
jgi:hypothetical protein